MIYMEKLLEDCNEVIKHFNEVIKIKKSKKLLPPRPRKDIVQGFLTTLHFYSIKKNSSLNISHVRLFSGCSVYI